MQGRGACGPFPAAMWSYSFSFSRGSAFGGVDSSHLCAAQHLEECLCRRPARRRRSGRFWRSSIRREGFDATMAERRTIRPGGSLRLSCRAVDLALQGNRARRVPYCLNRAGTLLRHEAARLALQSISGRSLNASGSAAAGFVRSGPSGAGGHQRAPGLVGS